MKKHSILLVDADRDSESIVSQAGPPAGRKVVVAETSRDAFRLLANQIRSLDLIIVDVDPGAHGLALLEAISGYGDRPQIVVITALEEAYVEPIAIKHGASACLGKPLTVQRLISVIRKSSKRSLTCDRSGCIVPPVGRVPNLDACFGGIAAKMRPPVCRPDLPLRKRIPKQKGVQK
jgi:DNA-binding NtrC family response regulator